MKRLLFVIALLAAGPAVAQDAKFYAGGHIGQASAKSACDNLAGTGISCDDEDTAWRALVGYQFNRHFAAEFAYTDLGEVTASFANLRETVKSSAFEIVGVGMFPVADRLSIYGKLGIYRAETEDETNFGFSAKEKNTDLTFGFGVRYDFTSLIAARAEWQRYQDVGGGDIGESDVDVISLGVLFKF